MESPHMRQTITLKSILAFLVGMFSGVTGSVLVLLSLLVLAGCSLLPKVEARSREYVDATFRCVSLDLSPVDVPSLVDLCVSVEAVRP